MIAKVTRIRDNYTLKEDEYKLIIQGNCVYVAIREDLKKHNGVNERFDVKYEYKGVGTVWNTGKKDIIKKLIKKH